MYIIADVVRKLEAQFGRPSHKKFRIECLPPEFDRIRSSQVDGRKHDITLYIIKDRQIVVNAKHFYPPGLFRAPSGGVKPGENVIDGAVREAHEETGCHIEIERFLLNAEVEFTKLPDNQDIIEWSSYVFQARYLSGDFEFTDTTEIREVRLAHLSEFEQFSRIMRQSDKGGLHYRADLHDSVAPLLSFD